MPETTPGHGPVELIGAAEIEHQSRYIKQALDSAVPAGRQQALAEGLLRFGPRFLIVLGELYRSGQERFRSLGDEAIDIFTRWLSGARLKDRADEDERRAIAAAMTLALDERFSGLERLAALSILALPKGHPRRDVALAHESLRRHLDRCQANGNVNGHILTIRNLLDHRLESIERSLELVREGERLLEQVPDTRTRRDFRLAIVAYYHQCAIAERDRGNREGWQAWGREAAEVLEQIRAEMLPESADGPWMQFVTAFHLDVIGKFDEAAELYARWVDAFEPHEESYRLPAINEGRVRTILGDFQRIIKIQSPLVPALEEAYLTAVEVEAIRAAGSEFAAVVRNLAFAHAHLGQWAEALAYLEMGKSLRLRYRAALHESAEGQHILELEAALHALARGVPVDLSRFPVDKAADLIGAELSQHDRMLEAYRVARPSLSSGLLSPPSISDIAGVLQEDEAVVVLGTWTAGTLMAMILPHDRDLPSGHMLLKDWPIMRLLQAFAGSYQDGWLAGWMGLSEWKGDRKEALSQCLSAMEEAIGHRLGDWLRTKGVRRVTIIPHLWLHIVPFWALPSLTGFEVVMAPSAALFVRARQAGNSHGRKALVVTDPTLDLPLSAAEASAVGYHLSRNGWEIEEVPREQASEKNLLGPLSDATIFHFCGHGFSDLLQPLRSALLVHPEAHHLLPDGRDPFEPMLTDVSQWIETSQQERYADVPGVGRLYEWSGPQAGAFERLLEYQASGTLWGRYQQGRLVKLAELWTAGDIMVQGSLRGCRLAFLSACESSSSAPDPQLSMDEYAGLPAALQLAGVSTVVGTLWPVADGLSALYVNLFYQALAGAPQPVNIAALVRQVGECLRNMTREEATSLLHELRRRTGDAVARFRLEAYAGKLSQGDGCPFSHPYDWAAFYVIGAGDIALPEEDCRVHAG